MNIHTNQDLSMQLLRMERECRRARRFAVLCVVCASSFAVAMLLGATPAKETGPSESVDTKMLRLIDDGGNARAAIRLVNNDPMLTLFGSDGKSGISMSFVKGSPSISFVGPDGQIPLQLSLSAGHPSISMFDTKGKIRLRQSLDDGTVRVVVVDRETGKTVHSGSVAGDPSVVLFDASGNPCNTLETSGLAIADADGHARARLGLEPNGPVMMLFNAKSKSSAVLEIQRDGAGSMSWPTMTFYDDAGKPSKKFQ